MKSALVTFLVEADFCAPLDGVVTVHDHPPQAGTALDAHMIHDDGVLQLHVLVQEDLAADDGVLYGGTIDYRAVGEDAVLDLATDDPGCRARCLRCIRYSGDGHGDVAGRLFGNDQTSFPRCQYGGCFAYALYSYMFLNGFRWILNIFDRSQFGFGVEQKRQFQHLGDIDETGFIGLQVNGCQAFQTCRRQIEFL